MNKANWNGHQNYNLNRRHLWDHLEQDHSNMYWKTSGGKENESKRSTRKTLERQRTLETFHSFTSMKQKQWQKIELPATQLHHWVFMKQTYKRQTPGTKWAVFAAGLNRQQAVMRRGTVRAPTRIFCFQNAHSDWGYECTPNIANFCATGIMLPGHSEVCLASVTPWWLELRGWVNNYPHCMFHI
jgi:hypothetical protein